MGQDGCPNRPKSRCEFRARNVNWRAVEVAGNLAMPLGNIVTRKSGVSPACYEEVTRKLATSPTSPRGSYGETGPSRI